jgi:hypothetical protein
MDRDILEVGIRSKGVGEISRKISHDTKNVLVAKSDPATASSASSSFSSQPMASADAATSRGSFGPRIDFLGTSKLSRATAYRTFIARELPKLLGERCVMLSFLNFIHKVQPKEIDSTSAVA